MENAGHYLPHIPMTGRRASTCGPGSRGKRRWRLCGFPGLPWTRV